MRLRLLGIAVVLLVALSANAAWADHIVMKDGREYSGKFIRGDAASIEFRILGRVETFKVTEVDRIVFKEPELTTAPEEKKPVAVEATKSTPVQPESAPVDRSTPVQPPVRQAAAGQSDANTVTIPQGTPITIRTSVAIDTDRNRVGDTFDATLEEPLTVGDQTIAPRGTEIKGDIGYAKESGRLTGQSTLILELKEIKINGKSYALRTSDYTEVGSSRGKRTATMAGGGAALGAIIGAIAGGGKGAAVGAATGAAAGTGVQILTKGETLKVPAETILEFKLESPLVITLS